MNFKSLSSKKIGLIIMAVIAGGAVILGLLFYYQSQGLIKIFPTRDDLRLKAVLEIDKSKFTPFEGLNPQIFDEKVALLSVQKEAVLADIDNPGPWIEFANNKEFLNDHAGAVAAWEVAYDLNPDNFQVALNLATVYQYFIKDVAKAEFYYLRVMELQPQLKAPYEGLTDLYRYNWPAKVDQLEPFLNQAAINYPANAGTYYFDLVEFFLSPGHVDEAKATLYYQKTRQVSPTLADKLVEYYPEKFN